MTIFDIKPYSFWRNMHKTAYRAWAKLGQDTPRTVLRLYLLEHIVEQQRRLLAHLTRDNRELREAYQNRESEQP